MGGWSSEGPRLRWGGTPGQREGQREKQISILLKSTNWYKSLRGHGEQPGPTPTSTRGCRVGPDPQHPQGRKRRHSHPQQRGTRHRQVQAGKGEALAAPPTEQGQLSSPPGVALPLARGRGAGVAWDGCLSCSNSLLPSTVAPWGQKELAAGTRTGPLWGWGVPGLPEGWGSHKPPLSSPAWPCRPPRPPPSRRS